MLDQENPGRGSSEHKPQKWEDMTFMKSVQCPLWPQCMEQGRGWRTRGEAGGQRRQTIRLSGAEFQTSVNIPRATVVTEGIGVGLAY